MAKKRKPKFKVGMKVILTDTGLLVELVGKEAPDLFVWRNLKHSAIGTAPRHLLRRLTKRERAIAEAKRRGI